MNEAKWIRHDGGPCPIPWAKEGEFVYRDIGNGIMKTATYPAVKLHWPAIDEYRLTNDWLPVIGSRCPEAVGWQAHTWEWRDEEGTVFAGRSVIDNKGWSMAVAVRRIAPVEVKAEPRPPRFNHDWHNIIKGRCDGLNLKHGDRLMCQFANGTVKDLAYRGSFMPEIVAVRRVEPAWDYSDPLVAKPLPTKEFEIDKTEWDPISAKWIKFKVSVPVPELSPPPKGLRKVEYYPELQPKGYNKILQEEFIPKVYFDPAECLARPARSSDAYLRFRDSPRGREALSMIGKAEGPAFAPLGEDVINEIAADALEAHDKIWPRRR